MISFIEFCNNNQFNFFVLENTQDFNNIFNIVKNNPKDKLSWLALADWLEENGDQKSDLIRGLIDNKKRFNLNILQSIYDSLPQEWINLLSQISRVVYVSQFLSSRYNKLTLSEAAEVINLIKSKERPDRVMNKINNLMHGFGVEAISGDRWDNYFGNAVALYVNTGDSYKATVLYNIVDNRYQLTTMGDFIERYQRQYGIN
jgi:uncharacterized protein (TIGR02996 family)